MVHKCHCGDHEQEALLARFVQALETISTRSCDSFVTKEDLDKMETRIMSVISEFSDKVNTAFEALSTSVDGVVVDVEWLKNKITELQNTPGQITPEDQALLNAIETKAAQLVTKVKDLDDATNEPPTP